MEDRNKSNEKGRKENDGDEEKPNKEGAVDDEEGAESTHIKEKKDEEKRKPIRKSENGECEEGENPKDKERKEDDVKEKTTGEDEKVDNGIGMKPEDKGGKEDVTQRTGNKEEKEECKDKGVKEERVFKDVTGNRNEGEKTIEVLQVVNDKVHETEVQEVINNNDKEGLKKLSIEVLPSEEGNVQPKTIHDETASINKQDSVPYKELIKVANGETTCGQSSNQATSSKELLTNEEDNKTNEGHNEEIAVGRTEEQHSTDKTLQADGTQHEKEKQKEHVQISDNLNKELKEEEMLIEVKEEKPDKENTIMKKESKAEYDKKSVQGMTVVEGSADVSLGGNQIHKTLENEAKEQGKLSVTDNSKGGMEMENVIQKKSENKTQEMSYSGSTIKSSFQNEIVLGKQELQEETNEKEKNEADNKMKKENSTKDFNVKEKERKEEHKNKEQKKEPNGDKRVLDSSYKAKSLTQKAADKVREDPQKQQHVAPLCKSQETAVKSKEEHTAESSKALASAVTLPPKISDEDQPQGIHNKALSIPTTGKPIHTLFQGTVSKGTKCEESIQRSDITRSRQNEECNKVRAGNSPTETAINDQLKQMECKVHQQSPQKKPTHPKQQKQQTQVHEQKMQHPQKQQQQQQQQQKQIEQNQQQQQTSPAQQNEEQTQQQKQKDQQKEQIEKIQKKQQIQQIQDPQKQKIQKTQEQGEKEYIQKSHQQSQQSLVKGEKIQKEELAEQEKQMQQQKREQSHQKQLVQKTKKQVQQQQMKQENKEQQQYKQQCIQPHMLEKQREPKEQHQQEQGKQLGHQQQQCQLVEQFQQEPTQQKQKKQLKQQKPQEQQQKQVGQKQDEDKPKQQQQQQKEQPNQEQQEEQPKQQSEEGEDDSAAGCGGMQGRNCPIYFGVKSYLHHFYDATPVKNSELYEDYVEEDDFEYTVDPIKSRGCRKCCRGFWFRAGLWGGINLILVGVITLLVGYLTPQHEMIVGHHNNLEILDRTAIAFNRRLELCRLAGLAVFCCGGLVLLVTLLLSTFFHIGGHNNNNGHCCSQNVYYGYVTTSLVEPFLTGQVQDLPVPAATGIKIPITEQIKSVQPTLWPDIATVKDGALVSHMP